MAQIGQHPYVLQQQQYIVPGHPHYMTQNQNTPTTILYTASATPVQLVNVNSNECRYKHYQSNSARILGILQIALGITIFVIQIVVTALHLDGYKRMSGLYSPLFFILAGAFGVLSAKRMSHCVVVTTMVMSIISSIFSITVIFQGGSGVAMAFVCSWERGYEDCDSGSRKDSAIALYAIMIIAGVTEFIVAIVAAAYCCHGCCCGTRQGVVLNQGPAIVPGVQMTTTTYPHNGSYPAAAPVGPSSYPQPTGAWPQYDGSTPPPAYQEKI